MVGVGETAAGFTLPGTGGESIDQYSLLDGLTDWPVVLVFYPFDFSPVCAKQLCSFRDIEWLSFTDGIDVWGISPDSSHCHRRFMDEYDLTFPLLTDRLGEVAESYGLLLESFENHPAVPKRAVLTVDTDRTVRSSWKADSQYQAPATENIETLIDWYRDDPESGPTG